MVQEQSMMTDLLFVGSVSDVDDDVVLFTPLTSQVIFGLISGTIQFVYVTSKKLGLNLNLFQMFLRNIYYDFGFSTDVLIKNQDFLHLWWSTVVDHCK